MITIAVCDDNKTVCAQLEDIILNYAKKACLKISVEVFYSGESLPNYIININSFDLIFLDIEMNQLNGVEVGRKLRKDLKDYKTEIIFLERQNRRIMIATIKGKDYFYGALNEVTLKLSAYQFVPIHRSYLINYNHAIILRYSEVVMSNGMTLPVSRSKRQELRNLHINEIV